MTTTATDESECVDPRTIDVAQIGCACMDVFMNQTAPCGCKGLSDAETIICLRCLACKGAAIPMGSFCSDWKTEYCKADFLSGTSCTTTYDYFQCPASGSS